MRALAWLLSTLLLTAAAPLPPRAPGAAPAVERLAADSAERWVPFTLTRGNQIRFAMTLDGRPVSAILDTGLSFSVLSRDYVRKMGLAVSQSGEATVIGGAIPIGWVATDRLALGGLSRSGGEITVAAVPALAAGGGAPIDLLVGPDLLAGYALDIDYDAKRFRLLPSGRLPFRGTTAPLSLSARHHIYVSSASLNGHRLNPVVVDTGDGSMLTVSQEAWRAAEPAPPPTTAISYGLGGAVVTGLAIVPDVTVGDLDARNIEVRVEPAGGFSDAVGAEGRIGTGFLDRYRVLLDPGAGRMVLAPGRSADAMPVRSTSGLLLGAEPGRLRVMHVMRGSPAAAAGWHQGDLICRINGQPVPDDYVNDTLSAWTVAPPGTVETLGMCDGSQRTLTLARFY
jgi:hypothetical protein